MKNRFKIVISLFLLLFIMSSCQSHTDNYNSALRFVEDKGYNVVSDGTKTPDYILTKEDLIKLPYMQYWGVQSVNPLDYTNKTIQTYRFIVTNHPLDTLIGNSIKQTVVFIMLCDNRVIGGYSIPNNSSVGSVYSIDGKTVEQLSGMQFIDWTSQWIKKYS